VKNLRTVVVVSILASLLVPTGAGPVAAASCGVWRWPVKTLSDKHRRDVHFRPQRTTVQKFRDRSRPHITFRSNTPRTSRVEFRTWKLRARPRQATLEDDSDIHLVISVPHKPRRTMIVEFPKRSCVASAFKRRLIARARSQFLRNCGPVSSSSWSYLGGLVTIVGVGFWDEKHGQTGIAPNGIELHPVLRFRGTCHKR
jgi:hypothetical protein